MAKWDKENLSAKQKDISQLYVACRVQLYQFVISTIQDKELANDIVQETFLEALRQYDEFRQHPQKIGWLYITARNKIHEITRKLQQMESAFIEEDSVELCRPEEGYAMKEIELMLRNALTQEEMTRFYRYFVWGYTIEEMAKKEAVSVNNMSVRLSRLRKKLNLEHPEEG